MAQCIYPITIGRKDGLKRWKVVPCGKCQNCRRRRQAAWSFRLLQEMQHSHSAAFLTFTYEDEHLPLYDEDEIGMEWAQGLPTLNKRDLQLFFKRLRKYQSKESDWKIRYYACGEYGDESYRPLGS